MTKTQHTERGFSLLEVVIATAIMLTVTGAVFSILNPSQGIFQTQPEVVDMQQRLRIGVDTLTRDIVMAGAGAYSGSQSGSLMGYFAPIQPQKIGNLATYNDAAGTFHTDAITVFFVPSTSSQTTLLQPMATAAADLQVTSETNTCPAGVNLCGFTAGMQVLLYDTTGSYDTMTVTGVQDAVGHLQHNQAGELSKAYPTGTKVVQVQQHVYFLNTTTRQLMHYDGYNTATPVLDEVVGLTFEYYADPTPPALVDPSGLDLTKGVTYGTVPPAANVTVGAWPAGENCTIKWQGVPGNGGTLQPRLATLGAAGTSPVLLTAAQLTDGPWCPDVNNANKFDADLLRVRKVRVTLRLQTGNPSLRGSMLQGTDAIWVNPGSAKGARVVPDQQIKFDVSPRNMNLIR